MDIERQYYHRDVFTKWVDLAYNKLSGYELLVIAWLHYRKIVAIRLEQYIKFWDVITWEIVEHKNIAFLSNNNQMLMW